MKNWLSSMTHPSAPPPDQLSAIVPGINRGEAEVRPRAGTRGNEIVDIGATDQEPIVIPVVAESLVVSRRVVDTGRGVRVVKTVREHEEVVDEPLSADEVLVERTEVNRLLADGEVPSSRQEGDVTIVPVLEEVLVTQKRLLLKEEIRITRVRREVHQPQRVMLRTEQVSVENFDESKEPADPD